MDFETFLDWEGGYPGTMTTQNGCRVDYSPPVEFGGLKGLMSPEDAFVGAANMCFQIVFAGIARSLGLEITRFSSRAVGELETVEGVRKFTRITILPEIILGSSGERSKLEKALDATKRKCPITNSMNVEISVSAKLEPS